MTNLDVAIQSECRWLERASRLPEGSVTANLVNGELVFYKFGTAAGRVNRGYTAEIIRTWEGIHNEQRRRDS